jgi:hypothetical protein
MKHFPVVCCLSSSSLEQTYRSQACARSAGQEVCRLSVSQMFIEVVTKDHKVPLF